jgi:uncharacterized membrane protein
VHNVEAALFGLLSAAAFGFSDFGAAITSRLVGSRRTTGIVVPVSGAIIVVLYLATGSQFVGDAGTVALACLSGIGAAAAYFFFYAALRAGPVSIVNPIVSASGGVTVLLSILLLGERPSAISLVAAILATIGVVLTGVVFGGRTRARLASRGVLLALGALGSIGGLAIVSSTVVHRVGPLPALTVSRIATTAVVLGILAVMSRRSGGMSGVGGDAGAVPLRTAGLRTMLLLVVVSVLEVAAIGCFYLGLSVGDTWIVGLTASFGPMVGIVGGVVVFGERPSRLQWVGVVLVLGSAVLLAAG